MCRSAIQMLQKWLNDKLIQFHATLCKHSVCADEEYFNSGDIFWGHQWTVNRALDFHPQTAS